MAKTYDIRFDRELEKYLTVDVTAVLKQRKPDGLVEVDNPKAQFLPARADLIEVAVRREGMYAIGQVKLTDGVVDRPNFDDLINEPIDLKVISKAPAADGTEKEVVDQCQVKVHPIPPTAKLLTPTKEQLPWSSRADNPMEMELLLYRRSPDKPIKHATVVLERRKGSKPREGSFDSTTGTTDDQGKVKFTYRPADLWYRPKGVYQEEFAVLVGDAREDGGLVKLPLAPRLKCTLNLEKKREVGDREIGIKYDPSDLDLVLGPDKQYLSLVIRPWLESTVYGDVVEHHVKFAKIKIDVYDREERIPLFTEGQEPLTDSDAKYIWWLHELEPVFPQADSYALEQDDKDPVGSMNEATMKIITSCEAKMDNGLPRELLGPDLVDGLLGYRRDFVKQLAESPLEQYARIWSAAELVTCGAIHTTTYNNLFNRAWGVMGDVTGVFLSDLLSLAVKLMNVSKFCTDTVGPKIQEWFGPWVRYVVDKPWFQRFAGWVQGGLVAGLEKCKGFLQYLIDGLNRLLPGSLSSLWGNLTGLLSQLGADISRLVSTTVPQGADDAVAFAKTLAEWMFNVLRILFNAVGRILLMLADIAKGLLCLLFEKLGALMAALFETASPFAARGLEKARELIARYIKDGSVADEGYVKLTIKKLITTLISWFNEKVSKTTSQMGEGAGRRIVAECIVMDLLADGVLENLLERARDLQVPEDHDPRLREFREYYAECSHAAESWEKVNADVDMWMKWLDTFVLCCEAAIFLIVTLLSLGSAAAIGSVFSALDLALVQAKLAMVRCPQAVWTVVLAFAKACEYSMATSALVEEPA